MREDAAGSCPAGDLQPPDEGHCSGDSLENATSSRRDGAEGGEGWVRLTLAPGTVPCCAVMFHAVSRFTGAQRSVASTPRAATPSSAQLSLAWPRRGGKDHVDMTGLL